MAFENRVEAGRLLAKRLSAYAGKHPLILAIPRGGLPLGRSIADWLGGDLDVLLVHKLRSPDNREFAIGSVAEDGHVHLGTQARTLGVSDRYLKDEVAAQLEDLRRRRQWYTPVRPPIDATGRTVIVVDDGLATGFTMMAALRSLRRGKPSQVVVAVPVAPPEAVEAIRPYADAVVCLEVHDTFASVGQYYQDFSPVTDDQAIEALVPGPKASFASGS